MLIKIFTSENNNSAHAGLNYLNIQIDDWIQSEEGIEIQDVKTNVIYVEEDYICTVSVIYKHKQ